MERAQAAHAHHAGPVCGDRGRSRRRSCDGIVKLERHRARAIVERTIATATGHSGHRRQPFALHGALYGYWGYAAGKAKSAAKTELEKLKMQDMTCAELIKEASRIIYMVHDEVKDKMFELELSWVGEFSNGVHQRVPEAVHAEAERFAKAAMEEDSDSDDEDMS